jgi:hypothetical protein
MIRLGTPTSRCSGEAERRTDRQTDIQMQLGTPSSRCPGVAWLSLQISLSVCLSVCLFACLPPCVRACLPACSSTYSLCPSSQLRVAGAPHVHHARRPQRRRGASRRARAACLQHQRALQGAQRLLHGPELQKVRGSGFRVQVPQPQTKTLNPKRSPRRVAACHGACSSGTLLATRAAS